MSNAIDILEKAIKMAKNEIKIQNEKSNEFRT